MIIDFRVNPPYKGWLDHAFFRVDHPRASHALKAVFSAGASLRRSNGEATPDDLIADMDSAGVDVAVISTCTRPRTGIPGFEGAYGGVFSPDELRELTEMFPGRFIGIGSVTLDEPDPVRLTEEMLRGGFPGLCVNSPMNPTRPISDDDPRALEVFRACEDGGAFVVLHRSIMTGPLDLVHPRNLLPAARAFPGLTFVVGHGSWPYTRELIGVAMACPNVVLMPDVYLNTPHTPGRQDFVDAAHWGLDQQIIFGSCYPVRPIATSVSMIKQTFPDPRIRANILGANAARILGLGSP